MIITFYLENMFSNQINNINSETNNEQEINNEILELIPSQNIETNNNNSEINDEMSELVQSQNIENK